MRLVTQGLINKLHSELIPIWVCFLKFHHSFWSFERNSSVEIPHGSTEWHIEIQKAPMYVDRALANCIVNILLIELLTTARMYTWQEKSLDEYQPQRSGQR